GGVGFGGEYGPTAGANAVSRHVPRDDIDASRVRTDAELVVIMVSDEKPQEIEDAGIFFDGDSDATPAQLSAVETLLKPDIDIFTANQAIVHVIAVPPPFPSCSD